MLDRHDLNRPGAQLLSRGVAHKALEIFGVASAVIFPGWLDFSLLRYSVRDEAVQDDKLLSLVVWQPLEELVRNKPDVFKVETPGLPAPAGRRFRETPCPDH